LHRRRLFRPLVGLVAAAALVALAVASAGSARELPELAGAGEVQTSYYTPRGLTTEPVTVMVQLSGETVAESQAKQPDKKLSQAEKDKIKAELASKQESIKPAIRSLGGTVLNDFQAAYNGISVSIALNRVAELRKLSNVIGVHAIQPHERSNAVSVPYIGAPQAWNGPTGFRGDAIKVAIIDTGIDYTHGNFRAAGTIATPAEFMAANAADTLPANPALFGPAAAKVKGGIDLVGDAYNASANLPDGSPDLAARTPHPDPNPLDCNGHGSHVAGSAAGFGVLANGASYGGPYDTTTHTPAGKFRIGPGVAPQAHLYAVRVFGCLGSTNVTVDAIEWAVDNGMDVINMSLGNVFGTNDQPSAVASTNAAKAGIIVVAAAGNNGPSQYIGGSPGVADSILSVAANESVSAFPGFTLSLPSGTPNPITAINANGETDVANGTQYTIVTLVDNPATPSDESLGCNTSDYPDPPNATSMAVTIRGVCARVARAIFGQQRGYAAVAMVNNATALPPFEGPIFSNPDTGEQFEVTIPFIGVRGLFTTATSDGARLRAANGALTTVNNTNVTNLNFTGLASFTSGGPRNGDSFLKPQITAPGVSIFSTGVGTGNAPGGNSGTSMASPHVAGVAALVKQAHPTWKPEDLHAAIANTGRPSEIGGATPYRVSRAGTGLVDPAAATKTQVVAFGEKSQFALNFGFDEQKDKFNKSESIHIRNNGTSRATFDVAVTNATTGSPHTVDLGRTSISVPARGAANFAVKLDVPANTAGRSIDPATGAVVFREVAGLVTLTPTGGTNNGVTLRVPYYLVPRALSLAEAKLDDSQPDGPSFTTTARVENKSGAAVATAADFYAWGLEDGNDLDKSSADLRAVGVQAFPFPSASVPNRRLIVFATSSWHRWSNAATNEFDIFVDVDQDGTDDYIVIGVDLGAVSAGVFNGQMAAFVFSTRSPGFVVNFFAGAPSDSSTATLPVFSTALCRTGEPCLSETASPRLTYTAVGFDLVTDGVDPVGGEAEFNVWNPSLVGQSAFFPTVNPGQTVTATVGINNPEWDLTPAKGVMVVLQDNASGKDEAALLELKR
jgi:minor extracellular serine protease Vpr